MQFLDQWAAEQRAKWDSHVNDWVKDRVASGREITADEWKGMRINSYEQQELLPLLATPLLVEHTRYCINNCGIEKPHPWNGRKGGTDGRSLAVPPHYDSAVVHVLLPLLIERLEAAEAKVKDLQHDLDQAILSDFANEAS